MAMAASAALPAVLDSTLATRTGRVLWASTLWVASRAPGLETLAPVGGHEDQVAALLRRHVEDQLVGARAGAATASQDAEGPAAATALARMALALPAAASA
jgi:hypothetical protein